MLSRTLVATAALVASPLCSAASAAADPEQFDVAGVKLGMGVNAAVAGITAKLGIDKRAIEFETSPHLDPILNSKEPKYFTVKTRGASITVHFETRLPINPKDKLGVSLVIYEQPWTRENVDAMKQMALEKYGQPTNGTLGLGFLWCNKVHPQYPGQSCSMDHQGPLLSYSGTNLRLEDGRYRQAVVDFLNKKQSSKPTF